jgi:hypothetical protein
MRGMETVRIDAPSPPVGEGITASRRELGWVRGSLGQTAMPRELLTRLRWPASQPPSPTRGEGKNSAIQLHHTT